MKRSAAIASIAARASRKIFFLCARAVAGFEKKIARSYDIYCEWLWRLGLIPQKEEPKELQSHRARTYFQRLAAVTASLPNKPLISVLLPVYRPPLPFLREALASVSAQVYTNWELCAVDDASSDPAITAVLEEFAAKHPGRVRLATHPTNKHISHTSNTALSMATGDYVALLDHDDRLQPNALAEIARYVQAHGEPEILYSDERVIESDGTTPHEPFFKPDWSPYLHLAVNYTTHLSVYRRALLNAIGGFRAGFEGAQDHDLMLRAVEAAKTPVVHVPFCLYQWRAHPASTASGLAAKSYAVAAGERAVAEACERRGKPAKVAFDPETLHYRVTFALPATPPLVSILIPSRDAFDLVSACLRSLFEVSTYQRFEVIIVDNGTQDERCLALFAELSTRHGERFRVIRDDGPFNFARLNNRGAAAARGEFVLLLNNDTVVETPAWIEEMLGYAQFPDVGAVGALLLYPDRKVQHAGLALIGRRIAIHMFSRLPGDTHRYIAMVQTPHEVTAVTGACMMVARARYQEVGGLDELNVPNGFGDVDFCLKLRAKGWSNVYTPYARLVHHESPTRGATCEAFERDYMLRRWGAELVQDRYLNLNFLHDAHCLIDREVWTPDLRQDVLMGFLNQAPFPAETGGDR